jgi:hypothetical protein
MDFENRGSAKFLHKSPLAQPKNDKVSFARPQR